MTQNFPNLGTEDTQAQEAQRVLKKNPKKNYTKVKYKGRILKAAAERQIVTVREPL